MGFFDKLIKGTAEEAAAEEKKEKKASLVKATAGKGRPKKVKTEMKPEPQPEIKKEKEQPEMEGQLAIDVYESNDNIVIQSAIAGIKPEDLDISVENDMVTIRGSRQKQTEEMGKDYLYQECFWGSFSRKIILPEEVDGSRSEAKMKDGVLTLMLPKIHKRKVNKIAVKPAE